MDHLDIASAQGERHKVRSNCDGWKSFGEFGLLLQPSISELLYDSDRSAFVVEPAVRFAYATGGNGGNDLVGQVAKT